MARRPAAQALVLRSAPAVLARVPLHPAEPAAGCAAEGDGLLAEAMFVASRQVGPSVRHAAAPDGPGRLGVTRRAYELRSRWRPTPHGAFAGVATARVAGPGETADLRLGNGHRARTNPSGEWLAALCDLLVTDPAVLGLVRFTVSNLVVRRGTLLEHEWRTRRVTIRATEATLLILRVCAAATTAAHIANEVTRRWPVPETVLSATLTQLVRGGFLLTDLLPPDVTDNPLGHLLGRLPPDHALGRPLAQLQGLLAGADRHPVGGPARLQALMTARDLADQVCLVDRPLSVNVAIDARIDVPASLVDEAARAASALWRVSDQPAPLSEWCKRFAQRYGPDRLVPLLEATDAATGLGVGLADIETRDHLTPGHAGGAIDEAAASSRRRLGALATLVAQALAHGQTEVIVDGAALAEMSHGHASRPPRTAEIGVRVIASSRQDLAAGRTRLAVVPPASNDAGCTIGRFVRLLPTSWPGEPGSDGTPLIAEIVTQPRVPSGAGLAPPTGLTRWRIPVGVPAREHDLGLADLYLVFDGRQLWCWSARHDRPVIPVLYSRLAPHLLPPIARFLQLLGNAGCRPLNAWSWGPLALGPFQPRVRYGPTILTPARWVLPPALTETAADRARWDIALGSWQATTVPAPPAVVVTDDGDRRLPLDLRRDDDRELLRRYTRRGLIAVCEPPGGPDAIQAVITSANGRHVLELVVPLAARAPAPAAAAAARLAGPRRAGSCGLYLPGGPWLSLAIRAPIICQDEILTQLAVIGGELASHAGRWFWLRYADQAHGPHLRIRFHGDPEVLGGVVLPAVSAWCADLIRQRLSGGFSVEPYDQEIERYGGPDIPMECAEQAFAADSRFVLGVLTATRDPDRRLTLAAVSAAAISRVIADGDPAAVGRHRLDRAARRRFETLRSHVRAAGPLHDLATAPDIVPGEDAAGAWTARHETLTAYRAALKPGHRKECAASLFHMHANRLLGDAVAERIATALAADLLARPAASR